MTSRAGSARAIWMISVAVAVGAPCGLVGCRPGDEVVHPSSPRPSAEPPRAAADHPSRSGDRSKVEQGPPFDWSAYRGLCVVAKGYAGGGAKTGARLQGGGWTIGVVMKAPETEEAWARLPPGARVQVRGVVADRADLPVFVQKAGEPVMQGMPVPEGTNLEKARHRMVIEGESVTVLRTPEQAEEELKRHPGERVSLAGVVWSLNGHWWFRHDGLDIHVEGQQAIPEWTTLHGRAVTLSGRLARRALPRIDQIALKPDRELADAFLVTVESVAPHPEWAVTRCP